MRLPASRTRLVALALFLATVSATTPANAISRPPPGYGDSYIRHVYFRMIGSGWDTAVASDRWVSPARTRRKAVTDGFHEWSYPRDFDGRTYVVLTNYPPLEPHRVINVYLNVSECRAGAYGCYDPDSESIYLSDSLKDKGDYLHNAAAHEMGHALGLPHSGARDAQQQWYVGGAQESLMTTCADAAYARFMDEDDASIAHKRSVLSPRPISANASVETGELYPWTSSGAPVTIYDGSSVDGRYHMMVAPNSSLDSVHQVINYDTAAGHSVSARINYLTPGGVSGQIKVVVWARPVYYPSGGCSGEFPTGRDENSSAITRGAWTTVSTGYFNPSNSWVIRDTPAWTLGAHGNYDFLIRIYSTVSVGGGYIHVHYDNVRIRDVA